ncbi:glycosyltransferase [Thermomonospora umbrina]|uniref:GT2 family glycosyltransferase n=1 Tax=Thermomonospora umbrina TaxID=111806 RepID=A0A3D9SU81_9ACTN|nr:glycosyltransferase [Thermomonospora umbrina]REE96545.1 GT2 family glycosyltransferase [Thermomonospora umbrina]
MADADRVVAVVVTYDRRELLVEALTALLGQTRPPDLVVVVDNASSDGSADLVATRFPDVDLIVLARNTGGAGGFAIGVARALEHRADAVWLLDDDTVPRPDALRALLDVRERSAERPALVASRVLWTDGRDHPMNTPRPKPRATAAEREAAATLGCVPIRSASFVSVLVDAPLVRERGLPLAGYFLWNDDFEFTTRLLRDRVGLWCPQSVVEHKTRTFGSTDADPGDRFFYEVRNKVWLFTRSRGLAPTERVLYAGSTARRWARTFARSSDRATLRRALGRGVKDGLLTGPAPTEGFLREAGVADPDTGSHDG